MRRLVLVRHGDYDRQLHLSDAGRRKIELLAARLKAILNGDSVAILTSIADRARESAAVLGAHFGVRCEPHEVLWSENDHPEDFAEAHKLILANRHRGDALILVTHYEYVVEFPRYFARLEFSTEMRSRPIGKGEAWVIDCNRRSLMHIT